MAIPWRLALLAFVCYNDSMDPSQHNRPAFPSVPGDAASLDPLLFESIDGESFGTLWTGSTLSPLSELLDPRHLEAQTFPVIYARGMAYAQAGNILRMKLFHNEAAALVAGSADEPYKVRLRSALAGHDARRVLHLCSCTCPFASDGHGDRKFCKHMVAVGIAANAAYAREREAFLIGQAAPLPLIAPDAPRRALRI